MSLNFVNYRIMSEITVNICTMTFNNKYDKEYLQAICDVN